MTKKLAFTISVFLFAVFTYGSFFGIASAQEINSDNVVIDDVVINNGDIVKTANSDDVYIIKLINNKQFKRLILNPDIFNSYGHLRWENVKTVNSLEDYQESSLVREIYSDGSIVNGKIYKLYPSGDTGVKVLFEGEYDEDSVYGINHTEAGELFYKTILDISELEENTEENSNENIVFFANDYTNNSPVYAKVRACDNVYDENLVIKNVIDNLEMHIDVCVLNTSENNSFYNMDGFRGLYDFQNNLIILNEDVEDYHKDRAILHEFVHSMQDNYLQMKYNHEWREVSDWEQSFIGSNFIEIVGFEKKGEVWLLPEDSVFNDMYNVNPTELFAELGALWIAIENKDVDGDVYQNVIEAFSDDLGEEKVDLLIDGIYEDENLLNNLNIFFQNS